MQSTFLLTWLPVLIVLAALSLWVVSVVDFTRTDEADIRTFPKDVWLLILALGSFMGAIMWIAVGRPRRQ